MLPIHLRAIIFQKSVYFMLYCTEKYNYLDSRWHSTSENYYTCIAYVFYLKNGKMLYRLQ